eukprot:269983_1
MTATYLPIINGNYGLNGLLNNFNPKTIENKKSEATKIINSINSNFQKLLTLTNGSIDLYQREMIKSNQRMSGIDENLDSLFCLVQNLNQNIIDINDKIEININKNSNKNMMEQMKNYVCLQMNSLRLDLSLIHAESMDVFAESIGRDSKPCLELEFDINTVSAPKIIAVQKDEKKIELQFDLNVLKHEIIGTINSTKATLQLEEKVSNIKYTPIVLKDFVSDQKNLCNAERCNYNIITVKHILPKEKIEEAEKQETDHHNGEIWYWKGPITYEPQANKLSEIVLTKDAFKHDKYQEEPPGKEI